RARRLDALRHAPSAISRRDFRPSSAGAARHVFPPDDLPIVLPRAAPKLRPGSRLPRNGGGRRALSRLFG
ncbi:MAG: hypothetical protein OXE85_15685, partial [Roseovarius sp.]|nr:hypothetical protein [Roseovarius sp.]